MIFDQLSNLSLYKGMHTNLDTAIDFLLTHDLETLPLGRTEIDGERVFLNKMEANAASAESKGYEVHKKYMDIQIDVVGIERVDTAAADGFVLHDFSEEKDIGFGINPLVASCTLGPGNFTVCLAGEPHKPGIQVTEDPHLIKCVIKVLA